MKRARLIWFCTALYTFAVATFCTLAAATPQQFAATMPAALDMGEPHVVTRIVWRSANNHSPVLGLFEGANRSDFLDALPVVMLKNEQDTALEVHFSRGVRYLRFTPSELDKNAQIDVMIEAYPSAGNDTELYQLTNLPTVVITTADGKDPQDKKHQKACQISIVSEEGAKLLSQTGLTRLRGNNSMTHPKKPYRIKFDTKQRVLDAPAKAKKWTLINNYGDKSLMRNMLAFEISRLFQMPYTPYCTPVDVVMNGDYKGCYQLCDQVNINKQRVNITEMSPDDNQGIALTGGYFVEVDGYAFREDKTNAFLTNNLTPVTLKSPDGEEITDIQRKYIQALFNLMEQDPHRWLDIDSYMRHFLIEELCGNHDAYWSVYFYKQRGEELLHCGPVWDFDVAFDNCRTTYPTCDLDGWLYNHGGGAAGNMRQFTTDLLQDSEVQEKRLKIWAEARENGLTIEHLLNYIDEQEKVLYQSQQLNFTRWDIMNQYVHLNPYIYGSYENEVEALRLYVRDRIPWMDCRLGYYADSAAALPPIDLQQTYHIYTLTGLHLQTKPSSLPTGVYIIRQAGQSHKLFIP